MSTSTANVDSAGSANDLSAVSADDSTCSAGTVLADDCGGSAGAVSVLARFDFGKVGVRSLEDCLRILGCGVSAMDFRLSEKFLRLRTKLHCLSGKLLQKIPMSNKAAVQTKLTMEGRLI